MASPNEKSPSPWTAIAPKLAANAIGTAKNSIERSLLETVEATQRAQVQRTLTGSSGELVSIIVTLFNCAEYVETCVGGLLVQAYPSLEIILVDDCSTDGTFELACEVARRHPEVTVLRTLQNAGTYVAKNLGMTHARGRYIAFQDCDDLSHPERIARQVAELNATPALVATSCHYSRFDVESGKLLLNRGEQSRPGLISLVIDWEKVRTAIGFFDCVRVNADDEYKLRIKKVFGRKALLDISDCYYFALLRANSLTASGHTANNLGSADMKRFLAPVRQRYTVAFQEWQRDTPAPSLHIEFPGIARAFPAPISIDPFGGKRFAANVLVVPSSQELRHLNEAIGRNSFYRRFFTGTYSLSGSGSTTDAARGDAISTCATVDKAIKEMVDAFRGGAFLFVDTIADLLRIPEDKLRRALYSLVSERPKASLAAFLDAPALYVPLEAMEISRMRFSSSTADPVRAALATGISNGARLSFH